MAVGAVAVAVAAVPVAAVAGSVAVAVAGCPILCCTCVPAYLIPSTSMRKSRMQQQTNWLLQNSWQQKTY